MVVIKTYSHENIASKPYSQLRPSLFFSQQASLNSSSPSVGIAGSCFSSDEHHRFSIHGVAKSCFSSNRHHQASIHGIIGTCFFSSDGHQQGHLWIPLLLLDDVDSIEAPHPSRRRQHQWFSRGTGGGMHFLTIYVLQTLVCSRYLFFSFFFFMTCEL